MAEQSKFISYSKLSKKKKKEINNLKRGSWHGLNPVTSKPPNPKAYNRQKSRSWRDEIHDLDLLLIINS